MSTISDNEEKFQHSHTSTIFNSLVALAGYQVHNPTLASYSWPIQEWQGNLHHLLNWKLILLRIITRKSLQSSRQNSMKVLKQTNHQDESCNNKNVALLSQKFVLGIWKVSNKSQTESKGHHFWLDNLYVQFWPKLKFERINNYYLLLLF